MRIFIGLAEVSGYYAALKKGFDELGIESIHVALQEHKFKYEDYKKLPLICKFAKYCVTNRVTKLSEKHKSSLLWTGFVFISRFFLFFWALLNYDVFLLSCGSSFFKFKEFPILKFFKKKLIYTFHGTDSRPGYIDGFALDISKISESSLRHEMIDKYVHITRERYQVVRNVEKYADVIIQNIPTSIFHLRPFIPFLIIGIPVRTINMSETSETKPRECAIRILHCPSYHIGKGTQEIRNAIKSLIKKGHKIKYVEISNKPNEEVLKEISKCDFIVDQVYSATPMAGFVSEAAFYGKPAVVGGYYSKFVTNDLKIDYIPPSMFCKPEDIQSAIERLIVDKEYRIELGKKAQDFVITNWSGKAVALRYLSLIHNDYPKEWLYEPKKMKYIYGGGIPIDKARMVIRLIIEKYGKEALCLRDKPSMEEKFIKFAFGKDE